MHNQSVTASANSANTITAIMLTDSVQPTSLCIRQDVKMAMKTDQSISVNNCCFP